jgi:hypothetical protein
MSGKFVQRAAVVNVPSMISGPTPWPSRGYHNIKDRGIEHTIRGHARRTDRHLTLDAKTAEYLYAQESYFR